MYSHETTRDWRKDHSRLIGGNFNEQWNLFTRIVLGSHRKANFSNPPVRLLKVYREALVGFSHIPSAYSLNTTFFFKFVFLKQSLGVGEARERHSKDRGGVRSLQLPRSRLCIKGQSHVLDVLLQRLYTVLIG